jgi:hypothetical protein
MNFRASCIHFAQLSGKPQDRNVPFDVSHSITISVQKTHTHCQAMLVTFA